MDVLPTLRRAATAQRRLRLCYASPTHERAGIRTVDPWGLVENGGRWYLVASHRGQARLFRLSRITAADILDAPAERPEDFDLTGTWRRLRANLEETRVTSTEVVIRVSPDVGAAGPSGLFAPAGARLNDPRREWARRLAGSDDEVPR